MSISHHLTDETLQDYSAGALSPSMEVVVACHMTLCSSCRKRAALIDSIGGLQLEDCESVNPVSTAQDVLDKDKSFQQNYQSIPAESCLVSGVPRPLGRLLPTTLEELDWKRLAPGIKQHNLSDKHRREGAFKLLNLAPGVVLSKHTHQDRELTLVLKGSYQDEIGRFKAGDIADMDADVVHQPVVDTDEPCIALIATMSPVQFSGVLGKIIQPFVGI